MKKALLFVLLGIGGAVVAPSAVGPNGVSKVFGLTVPAVDAGAIVAKRVCLGGTCNTVWPEQGLGVDGGCFFIGANLVCGQNVLIDGGIDLRGVLQILNPIASYPGNVQTTLLGQSLFMSNDNPGLEMRNIAGIDGGLLYLLYANATGQIEHDTAKWDGGNVQTYCEENGRAVNGQYTFECTGLLESSEITAYAGPLAFQGGATTDNVGWTLQAVAENGDGGFTAGYLFPKEANYSFNFQNPFNHTTAYSPEVNFYRKVTGPFLDAGLIQAGNADVKGHVRASLVDAGVGQFDTLCVGSPTTCYTSIPAASSVNSAGYSTAPLSASYADAGNCVILAGVDSVCSTGVGNINIKATVQSTAYVIPESGTVSVHVNATDLANGTAKVGGAWTLHGAVAYNPTARPLPSIGPFSDSNYYTQASSPANYGSGNFTCVVVQQCTSYADTPVSFATGVYNVSGYAAQMLSTSKFEPFIQGAFASTVNTVPVNSLNVELMGYDGTALQAELNDGGVVRSVGNLVAGPGTAYLGRYVNTGQSSACTISEVMCSNSPPGDAGVRTLDGIFNTIMGNIGARPGTTYLNGSEYVDGGITAAALVIGPGSSLTGFAGGNTCTISAGTSCTATTTGSTSSSKCWFGVQGSTPLTFMCACAAGAGTTVVTCPAATSATFNVFTVD